MAQWHMHSHAWEDVVQPQPRTPLYPPSISALSSGEASNRKAAAGTTTLAKPSSMWAKLLVCLLLLYLTGEGAAKNASETSVGEKLVIAKGKLMVRLLCMLIRQGPQGVVLEAALFFSFCAVPLAECANLFSICLLCSPQAPSVVGWAIKKMPELHKFLLERFAL